MTEEVTNALVARQNYLNEIKAELDKLDWNDIKEHYASNATDTEFALYLDTCKANALDPRKRECYFVKYGEKKGQIITGYQVYIKRAERTGLLDGWSVTKLVDDKGKLIGAKCVINRKDWNHPFEWEIDWDEFNKGQSTHSQIPSFMCKKICIAQAFRLAFPDELGGLPYTTEELATFADEDTVAAAVKTAKDVTGEVKEVKPAKKESSEKKEKKKEKKKEEEPEPEPKPKKKEDPEDDPVLLSKTTKATILSSFEQFDISKKLIESVLGIDYEEWNEAHREWLVEKWHICDAGDLDAKQFSALEYEK